MTVKTTEGLIGNELELGIVWLGCDGGFARETSEATSRSMLRLWRNFLPE